MGGFEHGRAMKHQTENDDYNQEIIKSLYGGGEGAPAGSETSSPASDAQPAVSDTARALAAQPDDTGNAGAVSATPAAQRIGAALVGDDYLNHLAQVESGGANTAQNPRSTALGAYQFTDPTWQGMMQQHPELGLTADGRTDPQQARAAAAALTADNAGYLNAKGIPASNADLYAAHFLGAPAAAQVLSQDASTPLASTLSPGVMKANPQLAGMNVGDFQNWAAQKMGQQAAAQGVQPGQLGAAAATALPQAAQLGASAHIQSQQGPTMQQLMAVMNDPRANSQTKATVGALMQNQLQGDLLQRQIQLRQSDPLYQAELNDRNAEAAYRQSRMAGGGAGNGLSGEAATLDARARAGGLMPGSPEYQQYMLTGGKAAAPGAGGVQPAITGDQAQSLGYDPTHAWAPQPNGTLKDMGMNQAATQQKRMQTLQAAKANADDVLASIDRVQGMNNDLGWAGHGATGHYIADVNPASSSAAFRNEVESLKSKLSYQTLDGLKSSGVSLGALSDGDMKLLSSASGALNPDGDRKTIQSQLGVIRQKVLDGYANGLTPQDKDMLASIAAAKGGASAQSTPAAATAAPRTTTTGVSWSIR